MTRFAGKIRFRLVGAYLALTGVLLIRTIFFDDHFSMFPGTSDLVLLLLMSPWIFLFTAIINYVGIEGNLVANLAMFIGVAINAAGLYYLGREFEHAPNKSLD